MDAILFGGLPLVQFAFVSYVSLLINCHAMDLSLPKYRFYYRIHLSYCLQNWY